VTRDAATAAGNPGADATELFDVDSKAECYQLNLTHIARNKQTPVLNFSFLHVRYQKRKRFVKVIAEDVCVRVCACLNLV